jgi:hypothetical protein
VSGANLAESPTKSTGEPGPCQAAKTSFVDPVR